MKTKRYLYTLSIAALMALAPSAIHGQSIVHEAGEGDLTFFYDSDADSFDVVFRSKGGTVATGLTNEYGGPPGGVGGAGAGQADWNFDSLLITLTQAPQMDVNGINYFVSPAEGSIYDDSSNEPDHGLRFRFREVDGEDVVDQFSGFSMTLDWDSSTRPDGAEFALFSFDEIGTPIVQYETALADFAEDWTVWGHDHWHWGFSQQGEYSLVFNYQGQLAEGGLSSLGTTTIDFSVVPEPSTVAFLLGLGAFGVVTLFRSRRKMKSFRDTA